MRTLIASALCLLLSTSILACAAITQKGTQCKRAASPGSIYCWQHGGTTKAERGEDAKGESDKKASIEQDVDNQRAATQKEIDDNKAYIERVKRRTTKEGNEGRLIAVAQQQIADAEARLRKMNAPVAATKASKASKITTYILTDGTRIDATSSMAVDDFITITEPNGEKRVIKKSDVKEVVKP